MTVTEHQSNDYLDQVVQKQQHLELALQNRAVAPSAVAAPAPAPAAVVTGTSDGRRARRRADHSGPVGGSAEVAVDARTYLGAPQSVDARAVTNAVDVRITGFGPWRTVVVPPNAFVVHTRRGRPAPLHVGLGVSFRYKPATDSFLVVPGSMQTILISAQCICKERQGLLVQAYVQWIIQDFSIAYRKLDFSDPDDPMRLVNLQLKEQAEAAIKDKVATMSVLDVLSDKQPIIEELTARLRAVAEGEGDSDTGLGLRIVTVQIKEAVVSSAQLWQNLQTPYRAEQERVARLAALAASDAVSEREMAADRLRESRELENERAVEDLRAANEAHSFDREAAEQARRVAREQDDSRRLAELQAEAELLAVRLQRAQYAEEIELRRFQIERDRELEQVRLDGELAADRARMQYAHDEALLELERVRVRSAIDNDRSPASLQAGLVAALPEIVGRMPAPAELRSVRIGGTDSTTLAGLVAELGAILSALAPGTPAVTRDPAG